MYIADKKLLQKKVSFRYFLSDVYGLGVTRRRLLLRNYGVLGVVRMNFVLGLLYKKVVRFLDENYVTERSLSRIVSSILKNEVSMQSLKGWRLINGLPINGQTSRPNGATAKRLSLSYHTKTKRVRNLATTNSMLLGPDRRKYLRKAFKKLSGGNKKRRSRRRFKVKGRFRA